MMYVCDVPESQVHEGGSSHSEISNHSEACDDVAGDSREGGIADPKLQGWEAERRKQICAGLIHSGLLIDFDYTTVLDQTFPVVPGDRTVSTSQSSVSLFINFIQGMIPFMSANILRSYTTSGMMHSASDDIESLVYVLIWMCILYAGLGTPHKDKHINKTVLKSWVSVTNKTDVSALAGFKTGLKYAPSIVTDDFTPFFKPLSSIAGRLLTQLGQLSKTNHLLNYNLIRDILLEGFGTVEQVQNWSGTKDVHGYGLLQTDSKRKHKIPSFATGRYNNEDRRNLRPHLH